jgi:hypothetical protein
VGSLLDGCEEGAAVGALKGSQDGRKEGAAVGATVGATVVRGAASVKEGVMDTTPCQTSNTTRWSYIQQLSE